MEICHGYCHDWLHDSDAECRQTIMITEKRTMIIQDNTQDLKPKSISQKEGEKRTPHHVSYRRRCNDGYSGYSSKDTTVVQRFCVVLISHN